MTSDQEKIAQLSAQLLACRDAARLALECLAKADDLDPARVRAVMEVLIKPVAQAPMPNLDFAAVVCVRGDIEVIPCESQDAALAYLRWRAQDWNDDGGYIWDWEGHHIQPETATVKQLTSVYSQAQDDSWVAIGCIEWGDTQPSRPFNDPNLVRAAMRLALAWLGEYPDPVQHLGPHYDGLRVTIDALATTLGEPITTGTSLAEDEALFNQRQVEWEQIQRIHRRSHADPQTN